MPKTNTVSKLRSSQYSEIDIKKYQVSVCGPPWLLQQPTVAIPCPVQTLPPIRSQTADSNSQQEFYEDWKKK